MVIYSSSKKNSIVVNLNKGTASGLSIGNDSLIGIENVLGGSKDDAITGDEHDNLLDGGFGVDTIVGGLGNDTLVSNGADMLVERFNQGHDLVISSVTHSLGANFEDLTLNGAGAINGTGNGLANQITGNRAANVLIGGNGSDTLAGGGGADTFAFRSASESTMNNRDTILDFMRTRGDMIDLAAIDANGGAVGEGTFTFIGKQDFHGVRGELRWLSSVEGSIVQADINGDGTVDLEILVRDVLLIKETDFLM